MSDLIITVLTGGRSSRMNFQNKSFLKIYDKTIIEILLDQLKKLECKIIINVNDDLDKYSNFGYELVSDEIKGRKGPLAGLHSAQHAAARCTGSGHPHCLWARSASAKLGSRSRQLAARHSAPPGQLELNLPTSDMRFPP